MKTDKINSRFCEKSCNSDFSHERDGECSDDLHSERIYRRQHPMTILALLFLAGILVLMPVLRDAPSSLQAYLGQTISITGTVKESRDGNGYLWLQCDEQRLSADLGNPIGAERKSKKEILYVSLPRQWDGEGDASAEPIWYPAGTRLIVTGVLEKPQRQRNPGGFDEAQWMLSKQARVKLQVKDMDDIKVVEPPQGIWRISYDAQCSLKGMAHRFLSEKQEVLALALLLGEKQQLDQTFYRLTQRMGIAHVFAVSGLHVGFIGALLLALFRVTGWERSWLSFICMTFGLGFYCMVTGLQPSSIRAALMMLLAALAMRLLRPPSAIDFLSLAAIILLLDNPFLLYTAGFQLSFGVTLALLLFVGPVQKRFWWIKSAFLRDSLAVAIAACLGSLPLTAWHFYTLSLLSPLYNLLLVPLVSVTVPILLIAFLVTAVLPAGGWLFFYPANLLLNLLLHSTTILADLFGTGHWYVGRPGWIAVCCYGLFLLGLFHRRKRSVVCLLLAVMLLIPTAPHSSELLYLDAGQGSCAILRTKDGETVIFDGGVQQQELASCLAWHGINEVKAVVLSHGDMDHIGGIMQVMENIPVQYLCVETSQMEREEMAALLARAEACDTEVKPVAERAVLTLRQGTIILESFSDGNKGTNSRELTASAQIGDVVIAFPGDLETRGAEAFAMAQQHIDIWTVPHHGSRYSASETLYQQLSEKGVKLAVISAGNDNRYGHPHQEVLQLLEKYRMEVYRTDQQGAIKLSLEKAEKRNSVKKSENIEE